MEIYVGASSSHQIDKAKQWVANLSEATACFDELEAWAKTKEEQWGICYVFIEVVLSLSPGTQHRRNQIDMLICFSDRLALCEEKSHRSLHKGVNLKSWYEQIEGQNMLLRELLSKRGWDSRCISPFLFLPRFNVLLLREVRRHLVDVHSAHHICPTGDEVALKGVHCDQRCPCYLPEALEQRLSLHYSPIPDGTSGLQEVLKRLIGGRGTSLRRFNSFGEAKTFLKSLDSSDQPYIPEAWHIRKLRGNTLAVAKKTLMEKGFVEILGAPGIGKSTFAKDLINEILSETSMQHQEFSLTRDCRSLRDIAAFIYERIGGDPTGLGQQTILESLVRQPYVLWMGEYGKVSLMGVQQLLQWIRSFYTTALAEQPKACWIFESVFPLQGPNQCQYPLGPLDNPGIAEILSRIPQGGAFTDPEEVVCKAQGNPRKAIRLWQSTNESAADASDDEVTLFRLQLSQQELRMFQLLCFAVSESPLGISLNSLIRWASFMCQDIPTSDVEESLITLLEKLESWQLVYITRVEDATFGGLLDNILPKDLSLVIVTSWSANFIDNVLDSLDEAKRREWLGKLTELLLDVAQTEASLAYVMMEIHYGNLEPFFRSSFRFNFSSVAPVLSWLDRTQWQAKDPTQTYLLRVLRFCTRLSTQLREISNIDIVEKEIGKPQDDDAIQCYAFDVAKAFAVAHLQPDADFDLSTWINEIETYNKEADLQGEILVRAVDALLKRNEFQKAWRILKGLLNRQDLSLTARCLVLDQALRYLNRTKVTTKVFGNENSAFAMIDDLVLELIKSASAVENLVMISNASFYYVRSHEYQMGRESFKRASYYDILHYTSALKFVEEVSPSRRLQALLTQGSIHRHFCRRQDIEWPEFQEHMEKGMKLYRRAFESATAGNHTTHQLNAVSYMLDFCVKSLRFAGNSDARKTIVQVCKGKDMIECADKIIGELSPNITRETDKDIMRSIQLSYPLLSYVINVSNLKISTSDLDKVKQSFDVYTDSFLNEINGSRSSDSKRRAKQVRTGLKRAISFGQYYPQNRVLKQLDPYLRSLLDRTERMVAANKKLQGPSAKLKSRVQDETV